MSSNRTLSLRTFKIAGRATDKRHPGGSGSIATGMRSVMSNDYLTDAGHTAYCMTASAA